MSPPLGGNLFPFVFKEWFDVHALCWAPRVDPPALAASSSNYKENKVCRDKVFLRLNYFCGLFILILLVHSYKIDKSIS